MTNKRLLSGVFFFITIFLYSCSSKSTNIIVLGDLHHDLIEDHDSAWLSTMPDNVRQVKEYTSYTAKYWKSFMEVIKERSLSEDAPVSFIIQLGDLSEGLAGTPEKARQMALHTMEAVENPKLPVPLIMVKGNHDITGPGAKEAYSEFYLPMIRKQTGKNEISSANFSYRSGDVQIICLDPWDSSVDVVAFLEKEFSGSDASVKIVALHEPIIPVTERCWHLYRNDPEKREKLLDVIAKNKALVICAHLHRYSVVRRNTVSGPIVQIMTISVVRDSSYLTPDRLITQYGPSLVDSVPDWDPPTTDRRKEWLTEESKYVSYYKQTVLPGYSLLKIDNKGKKIMLEYYAAFGRKPYDVVNISELMK
jgi:hypothetical protein